MNIEILKSNESSSSINLDFYPVEIPAKSSTCFDVCLFFSSSKLGTLLFQLRRMAAKFASHERKRQPSTNVTELLKARMQLAAANLST